VGNLVVGYIAALINTIPIMPFETVSLRVITNKENHGPIRIVRDLWKAGGLGAFYHGVANYPVLSVKPAVQETVIDQTKLIVLRVRQQAEMSAAGGFILGFWGRTVTTGILFPFFSVQTKVQTGNTGSDGVWATLARIVREQGPFALYRGIAPELLRGGLYQCFLTGTKDMLFAGNLRLVLAMSRLVGSR
jgi:hypothetical protein